MDAEVFLSGVPAGESFWGKDSSESSYFGTFYQSSVSENLRFLIQRRNKGVKTYYYYNYLRYNNIVANDGRGGSYFGLTLRLDIYCKDFMAIYRDLDRIFHLYILGDILEDHQSNYQYSIATFSGINVNEKMDKIRHNVLASFKEFVSVQHSAEVFSNLSESNFVSSDGLRQINIYEATQDVVEAQIVQNGKVALSPLYPMGKTAREMNDLNKQLDEKGQQLNKASHDNRTLRSNYDKLSADYDKLSAENKDLKKILNSQKANGDKMASTLGLNGDENSHDSRKFTMGGQYRKKKIPFSFLTFLVSFLSLLFIFSLVWKENRIEEKIQGLEQTEQSQELNIEEKSFSDDPTDDSQMSSDQTMTKESQNGEKLQEGDKLKMHEQGKRHTIEYPAR